MQLVALIAVLPIIGAFTRRYSPSDWTFGVDGALHLSLGTSFYAMNIDGSIKWTFDDAIFPIVAHKEGSSGSIYIVAQSSSGTDRIYYALDGMDGSLQWQRTSQVKESCDWYVMQLLVSDSTVYFVCENERIEAIDASGVWKWTEWFPNATQVDVGPDGGLLMLTEEKEHDDVLYHHSISALQPGNGAVKWTRTTATAGFLDGWAISKGDIFLAPVRGDKIDLLHLNGEDGSILWNVSYTKMRNMPPFHLSPISGCNGEVYAKGLEDDDGVCHLRAFDFDGNALHDLPCLSFYSTRQNEDGTEEDIFLGPTGPGNFIAYSGTTGNFLWNASIAGGGYFPQDFGPDGTVDGTVFVEESLHHKDVVAIRDGYEVWRTTPFMGALMAKDGTTYLQREDYLERVLNIEATDQNGNLKWSQQIKDPTVGPASDAQSSFAVV